ncbi:hypothetical protein L207DRAFT_520042 [Hyaloscypha variabilis F]|uniref:Uncharacterized protein n=1 Tax=Hyaloscypha variabilis (strain UAMH 11265 / GT02V1 / F) TaxID=1149755 RepID=A0A2J6QWB5_HYAVF|nr:hypothetical protein L207DRAFT_520042 [Hyaloscypha variabilis F]
MDVGQMYCTMSTWPASSNDLPRTLYGYEYEHCDLRRLAILVSVCAVAFWSSLVSITLTSAAGIWMGSAKDVTDSRFRIDYSFGPPNNSEVETRTLAYGVADNTMVLKSRADVGKDTNSRI